MTAAGAALGVDVTAANAATTSSAVRFSGTMKIRSGPTNGSAVLRTQKMNKKTKVTISCSVTGQYVKGPVRQTSQWDKLAFGGYLSHAYVVSNANIPACAPPPAPAAPSTTTLPAVPAGPTGTMTNAQFLAASIAPAQQSQRDTRVPASVTLAQAILESGWGRSALSANDKNFFGMKCFTRGTYATGCRVYVTSECNAAGVCSTTTATFRSYPNALASFRDHGMLLSTASRYANAFNYTTNPNQFAVEIQKAGYATDPAYGAKLATIMTTYNLYRYDVH
jgi:flagellar protein FlgJ